MLYVEFTVSQTMEHFLGCHLNAFAYFGARVPARIMTDNLKSAVLQRLCGQAPVFNPRYADFARHHRFEIAPCNVGAGHEKGRVEAGVGYVKKNLLAGLDIADFRALNPAARRWLDTVANVRIHGETRKRPVELFTLEREQLRPIPELVYDIGAVHTVRASNRFRVTFDTNRYSVPAEYASQRLTLKSYPERLCIYHQDRLVARHLRSYERHRDFEHPDPPCCFSVYLVTNVPDSAVVLVDETIRDAWVKETVGPWPEACLRPWEPLVVGSALRHPEGRSEAKEPRSGLTRWRTHDIASDDTGAM